MKKIFSAMMLALLAVTMWSCSSDDDDVEEVISYENLPAAAKTFLSTYFVGDEVVKVTKDTDYAGAEYEVTFKSGTEVEFDAAGDWVDVDPAFGLPVPSGIVPMQIQTYVSDNYPTTYISEISKGNPAWEIELSSGVEIQFDSNFNVLWTDM